MRAYVCFDDTDTLGSDRGTGKLVRWFADKLPDGCELWGVVRQQLLVHPDVPYTSHNSSACAVIDVPDISILSELAEISAAHIVEHFIDGSDPGLCIVSETDDLSALMAFGRQAAIEVVTQADAYAAARSAAAHLSGHGGTEDGVIGAAAGVGLTANGWAGRLIEYRVPLRSFEDVLPVGEVEAAGIAVLPVDRNVMMPKPSDTLNTQGWLRPRLWGGRAVLPVVCTEPGLWTAIAKRPPSVS
jgi:tRNA(Ile2) C34 agmatinyltransferase TiaS